MLRAVLTRPAFLHLGACAVALFAVGCGINCDRNPDEPAVDYRGGVTTSMGYDSTPDGENSPWLTFPAGRTYRFFHDLGGPPRHIDAYLAFAERCGAGARKVERYTNGAGNQVTIEDNTHPDYFEVRNDTCAEVCLRVYASDPILSSEPPEEDAGGGEETDSGAD
jgi:hypothetical protein